MRHSLFLLTLAILLTPFVGAVDFWSDLPQDQWLEQMLETMTPEEKLGQVFLLGYEGELPSPAILKWITERHLGGIKVFGWNADNLDTLARSIGEMQRKSQENRLKIPLFTATDQEGGWVRHIRGETSITPGNMAIGATGVPQDALYTGFYIGRELRALGINMNFAPTVDVYTNPEAHVIGPRAFSEDPHHTAMLGMAFYYGLEKSRVIATAKHFPGHGHADKDSHGELPVIHRTLEEMEAIDLVPFRFLIKEDVPAIMSGHLGYPELTEELEPATLSRELVQDLLRDRMGYDNLLITDDLFMGGAQATGVGFPEIGVVSLRAGNDVLLVSQTTYLHDILWKRILEEYHSSPSFRQRVEESVRRILRIKRRYLFGEDRVPLEPDPEDIGDHIPDPDGIEFFADLSRRSVTRVAGTNPPPDSYQADLIISQYSHGINYAREQWPGTDSYYFSYNPFYSYRKEDLDQIIRKMDQADSVLFIMATPGSFELLQNLAPYRDKISVLSLMTPIYFRELPWVKNAVAVYGSGSASIEAGIDALKGDLTPTGYLPIEVK